jgi:hypothetical protein
MHSKAALRDLLASKSFIRISSEESSVGKGSYQFVLVGIVGLVALVAVLILIQGFPSSEQNLVGKTSFWEPTVYVLEEGDVETIEGVEVEVVAIFPPDHTGKSSALFKVNDEWSARLYPSGAYVSASRQALQVTTAGDKVGIIIYNSLNPPHSRQEYQDTLFAGENTQVLVAGEQYFIELSAIDTNRKAHFRINDAEFAIAPGDSAYLPGATITVVDTAARGTKPGMASYFFTPQASSCGATDGQTIACRGSRACCGGVCQPLPDCTGKANGPVNTCGARQLYCCYGQLALMECPLLADDSGFGPVVEFPTIADDSGFGPEVSE